MKNRRSKIALVSLALAAPLAVGAVVAQTTTPSSPAAQAVDYAGVFLNRLASALGVTEAKLRSSLQQASNATIDQALRNQDITRAEADRLREEAQAGRYGVGFLGRGGFDRGGPAGRFGGRGPGLARFGGVAVFEAVAKALNLTATNLEAQLRAGRTVTELAQARGVSAQTVRNAAVAALKTRLDAEVTAGRLTRAQADQRLADARQDPDFGLGGRLDLGGRGGFGLRGAPGDRDGFFGRR